mmetsp:Transcript_15520/g.27788  ORF Transcript_15520/g.27788 Transcript_15520/m.27788 type:complete len:202 (-) Transcript_15520:216-821(-)
MAVPPGDTHHVWGNVEISSSGDSSSSGRAEVPQTRVLNSQYLPSSSSQAIKSRIYSSNIVFHSSSSSGFSDDLDSKEGEKKKAKDSIDRDPTVPDERGLTPKLMPVNPPDAPLLEGDEESARQNGPMWSKGSRLHDLGQCRPCAWSWKPNGCSNGAECAFCHTCEMGALKLRKKERIANLKATKSAVKALCKTNVVTRLCL